MKTSVVCFLLCLSGIFLLVPQPVCAQSQAALTPAPDQTLRDILAELRQLRAVVQHMNLAAFRAQVLLSRVRLEQEQVARYTREISDVRDKIVEVNGEAQKKSSALEEMTRHKEIGIRSEKDVQLIRDELEELKHREQALLDRESLLTTELNSARANLADLNRRLDALEQEMIQSATSDENQPVKRRQ